jgi:hypothetical protein
MSGDLHQVSLAIGQLQAGQVETHHRIAALAESLHAYRGELNGKLGDHTDRIATLEEHESRRTGARWALGAIWSLTVTLAGAAGWLWSHRPAIAALLALSSAVSPW